MHLDVGSEQIWVQVVHAVMAAHGRLDILFNNAGVSFPGKVEDITREIWERELGVHAKGVFLGTRTAIPAMRKGGERHRDDRLWPFRPECAAWRASAA